MRFWNNAAAIVLVLVGRISPADTGKPFDAAAAFGARPSIVNLSLAPDGKSIAYVAPTLGQGAILYTLRLDQESAKSRVALTATGKPERLESCHWVSNDRLICTVYGVVRSATELLPFTRLLAVNADGTNQKLLSTKGNFYSRGLQLGGGSIVDWLPDQDGATLMSRVFLPDDHLGSRVGTSAQGLGVDQIDTRTGTAKEVEHPNAEAVIYISDGRGQVRIMGLRIKRGQEQMDTGVITYLYRKDGNRNWQKLSNYNYTDHSGFEPTAVDREHNVAYGFKKTEGRLAFYSVALDGSLREELIYARSDVDVDKSIRIGRQNRTVGVSYATDVRRAIYFDPELKKLVASLGKALPQYPDLYVVDSSLDESKLLVFATSDNDPGEYYVFDRKSRELHPLFLVREELVGVKLATVKAVSYPATDGTVVPGYLTLPPGRENAKKLPTIVLPHGGPSARDEWGFDWLAQFYASRGFAVMQPNFRGSSGYGDTWFGQNGFRAWPTAIGDVLDAARWLVAQGIADPSKLAVVGWSYGGYAALQSAITDSKVFKAVVAIAPVTDLQKLKNESYGWSDRYLVADMIGDGPQVTEGSPARNAQKITVPVLLFHGAFDRNVSIKQSEAMAKALEKNNAPNELVTWNNLDHQLDDSNARAEMLRKSDIFLRRVLGM